MPRSHTLGKHFSGFLTSVRALRASKIFCGSRCCPYGGRVQRLWDLTYLSVLHVHTASLFVAMVPSESSDIEALKRRIEYGLNLLAREQNGSTRDRMKNASVDPSCGGPAARLDGAGSY